MKAFDRTDELGKERARKMATGRMIGGILRK